MVRIRSFSDWQSADRASFFLTRRWPAVVWPLAARGISGREKPMSAERKTQYENMLLIIIGLVIVGGFFMLLNWIWPAGWTPL